jgi:hypothetical protein
MMPKRFTRSLAAGGLGLSLILGMLAIPTIALAATPNWATENTLRLPDIVKQGEAAGFTTTIRNNGPSNISQLSVTAFLQQPYGAPAEADDIVNPGAGQQDPVYAAIFKDGVELEDACPTPLDSPLICDVEGLTAGSVATLVVAFPTVGTANIGMHGWWQSNGTGSTFCEDGGDNSQGDCLAFHSGATEISTSVNRGGGFSIEDADTAASNAFTATNLTFTSLTAPAGVKNVILTVADDGAVLNGGPTCSDCVNLPASELHLGDGSPLPTGTFMKVVVEFHKNALKGINFGKLTVRHYHTATDFHDVETKKSCDGTAECAMFQNLSGGNGRVTIYLNQNGFVKYH